MNVEDSYEGAVRRLQRLEMAGIAMDPATADAGDQRAGDDGGERMRQLEELATLACEDNERLKAEFGAALQEIDDARRESDAARGEAARAHRELGEARHEIEQLRGYVASLELTLASAQPAPVAAPQPVFAPAPQPAFAPAPQPAFAPAPQPAFGAAPVERAVGVRVAVCHRGVARRGLWLSAEVERQGRQVLLHPGDCGRRDRGAVRACIRGIRRTPRIVVWRSPLLAAASRGCAAARTQNRAGAAEIAPTVPTVPKLEATIRKTAPVAATHGPRAAKVRAERKRAKHHAAKKHGAEKADASAPGTSDDPLGGTNL